MALMPMDPTGEVDLTSMTLEQLAKRINDEYQQVEAAAERAVSNLSEGLEHAIRCGRYLVAVQDQLPYGEWMAWLEANVVVNDYTARLYADYARGEGKLRAAGVPLTTHTAEPYLRGLKPNRRSTPHISDEVQAEIKRLHECKVPQMTIARMLGLSRRTVWFYVDPEAAARMKTKDRETNRKRREARAALRREEQREERDRLAAERGGNLGKVSDIVRLKLMPAIDAAVSEGTLPIEARAVALRLEDEIFKALKR